MDKPNTAQEAETLQTFFENTGLTMQQFAERMVLYDRNAPSTPARVHQIITRGCNSVSTLRAFAKAAGVTSKRVYAANESAMDKSGV